jgi:holo-[acyl-carrier protein] synthase
MILGVGTDLVKVARIDRALSRKGERFARRILRPEEMPAFLRSADPAAHLAKRFAAKEAAGKALGTGIGRISWQAVEVFNDDMGAPGLRFYDKGARRLALLGARSACLSIADETDLALAFVVISR